MIFETVKLNVIADTNLSLANDLRLPFEEIDRIVNKRFIANDHRYIYFIRKLQELSLEYDRIKDSDSPFNVQLSEKLLKNIKETNYCLIRTLEKYDGNYNDCIIKASLRYGNYKIIKEIINSVRLNSDYAAIAAENGDYKSLKLLIRCQCPLNEYTFACVVSSKSIRYIKLLIKVNCPFDQSVLISVIKTNDQIITNMIVDRLYWDDLFTHEQMFSFLILVQTVSGRELSSNNIRL